MSASPKYSEASVQEVVYLVFFDKLKNHYTTLNICEKTHVNQRPVKFEMPFWCLKSLPKNEQKHVA